MAGVVKINITETPEELKNLMSQQKTAQGFERIQALYLLKTGQVQTVINLSLILGKHRVTIQHWLRLYRQEGIAGLLADRHSGGRKPMLPQWAVKELKNRLQQPEAFKSYQEILSWLKETLGVEASYSAVYELVRYKLKANFKVLSSKSSKLTAH